MPLAIPKGLQAAFDIARSPLGKWLGVALLILAAWLYVGHLQGSLKSARADLKEARVQLDRCQDNRKALDAALKAQNAAVDALKREGERLTSETAAAVRQAEKGRAVSEARAARLEALSRTFGKADACKEMEAADRAILKELAR